MKLTNSRFVTLAIALAATFNLAATVQSGGEAAAWARAQGSASASQLKAFLDAYPNGANAAEARQKYSLASKMMLAPEVKVIKVNFPQEALDNGLAVGPLRVVKLRIQVQQNGTAGNVDVAQTSGFDPYDLEAKEAARKATYLPAVNQGKTIDAEMDYDVSFGIRCNRATHSASECDIAGFKETCSATACSELR